MSKINVSATGTAKKFPDLIFIQFSFRFKENTYEEVLKKGTETIKTFNNFLLSLKYEENNIFERSDIISNKFFINEIFKEIIMEEKDEYNRPIKKKVSDGYSYNQTLNLEIDYNLRFLEVLFSSINNIDYLSCVQINYGLKDLESLKEEAMVDAFKKCERKAKILAEVSNQKIKKCKEINYDVPEIHNIMMKACNSIDTMETIKNEIRLEDVLNPEPIKVSEKIFCTWKVSEMDEDEEDD